MAYQRRLFRIGDLSLPKPFGDGYVASLELIDKCLQRFIQ
jgi:hypothetical protein